MAVSPEQRGTEGSLEDEVTLGGPKFDPPLYIQRYNAVLKVARKVKARKVSASQPYFSCFRWAGKKYKIKKKYGWPARLQIGVMIVE